MGTRGLYGLKKNNEDKLAYNHFDSYPECLGRDMIKFCKRHPMNELKELFNKIELVGEEKPTEEQKRICKKNNWFNDAVSRQSDEDWYCLLRETQGDLETLMHAEKAYMEDYKDFIKDSLSCEYAYIINLDKKVLEFWVGYQKTPTKKNRYGEEKDKYGYYPCKLLRSYPLPLKKKTKWYLRDMIKMIKKEG